MTKVELARKILADMDRLSGKVHDNLVAVSVIGRIGGPMDDLRFFFREVETSLGELSEAAMKASGDLEMWNQ